MLSHAVTQIPLESSPRQDSPPHSSRPPWIRPIRKKTPSVPRSNHSAESVSQHSSPEAFTPSEYFVDAPKPVQSYPSGPPSTSTVQPTPIGPSLPPPQYLNGGGGPPAGPSSFINTSGGMAMDVVRQDPQMYMSPADVMALFNDGNVDVGSLFSPEFVQAQQADMAGGNGGGGGTVFNNSPGFLKMNGLVATP